jgi:hypothetical protein
MRNSVIASFVLASALIGGTAQAQTPRVDVTLYPSGHLLATDGKVEGQPGFRSNAPTAGVAVNLSSYIALEGEFTGAFGVTQDLAALGSGKTPSMIGYSGNIVANLAPRHMLQPYLAVGVGGMRMLARESLGVRHAENLETANAGGGLKIMFGQWGLRADYRFIGFGTTDDNASSFIGSDVRHAHRISAGFIIAPGRGITAGNNQIR